MKTRKVKVNNLMQKGYTYICTAPVGKSFDKEFKPTLTPAEMLKLGVFGGRYLRDCTKEYPRSWFAKAKLHPKGVPGHSKELNYFKVEASQPLAVWRKKGWIYKDDPRGWFEWYCRYYMGRRLAEEDARQIKRWKAMRRHVAQIAKHCRAGDTTCHVKQRQALLHWAYDSRKI